MSKVINKITGDDLIHSSTFSSGDFATDNKASGQELGYDSNTADTIVKRDASGKIAVTGIDSTAVGDPGDDTLGFFGGAPAAQPLAIDAPVLVILESNDAAEFTTTDAAIAELQEKVGEIITALQTLGLIDT